MQGYFVYIMASQRNGTLYIGSSTNLSKRIWEHKTSADAKSFTSRYDVKQLVYVETFETAEEMVNRERNLKAYKRSWKIDLIEHDNPAWDDISLEI